MSNLLQHNTISLKTHLKNNELYLAFAQNIYCCYFYKIYLRKVYKKLKTQSFYPSFKNS